MEFELFRLRSYFDKLTLRKSMFHVSKHIYAFAPTTKRLMYLLSCSSSREESVYSESNAKWLCAKLVLGFEKIHHSDFSYLESRSSACKFCGWYLVFGRFFMVQLALFESALTSTKVVWLDTYVNTI